MADADLIIRGGTVVDGTGAPARTADVVVAGDRIVAVEEGRSSVSAAREIDADGLLVTPGFVDIHTHFDGQATWDPLLAPSSVHGVTSIVMGNCGVGFAPAAPDRHDWLISLLEGVEDIPGTALAEGLPWDWESFPEYLDSLARRGHVLDIGTQVPHSALRTYVMGDRGADHTEAPTDDELDRMRALLAEALAAGALGFATSRTVAHMTKTGEMVPTLSAERRELVALAKAMGEAGTGVIQLISDLYQTPDDDLAASELDLLGAMVEASGRPLSFTMQQAEQAPDRWRHQMGWIDAMVAKGHDVKAQVASRPIAVLLGLRCTLSPFLLCPSFGELSWSPMPERLAALADPERRARVLAEHAGMVGGLTGLLAQVMGSFDAMFLLDDPVDYELDPTRSIAAEAARRGIDPAGYVYDLLLEDGGDQLVYLPLFNFARRNLDDVEAMITRPNTLFGLSDAGAHCGTICDGSMTTSTLTVWARDRRNGPRRPIEELVHGHTQRNARHVGWFDRGVVAPGYLADLNLIDLDRLDCRRPHLATDLPAGGRRLLQDAEGYVATIKSGLMTFEDGRHVGPLPGVLLRGGTTGP